MLETMKTTSMNGFGNRFLFVLLKNEMDGEYMSLETTVNSLPLPPRRFKSSDESKIFKKIHFLGDL